MNTLKFAFRNLLRTPLVTGIAAASLALGIGANAAIYSLFDQLLLQELPVRAPGQLVNLSSPGPTFGEMSCGTAGDCNEIFSYAMFRDLEQADSGLSGLAAHDAFGVNLSADGRTASGEGMLVSGSYFPVLGTTPALGRLLGPDDDRNIGENFVAVLSWDYWQNQLGGDPAVLNTSMVINGQSMTIVGVAARGFRGTTLGIRPDVFVPISMRGVMVPGFDGFDNRRSYWAYLFGRLQPGISIEQAQQKLDTVHSAILNEVEAPLQEGISKETLERWKAKPLVLAPGYRGQSNLHRESEAPLLLLLAITGVVLLIACANIANLLLARGAGRSQEMAIRGSLGASRWQLLRQLLAESLMLAAAGGALSVLVARTTLGLIRSTMPMQIAGTFEASVSPTMMLYAGAVAIGTGLLFGFYPALHATRRDLVAALKDVAGQPAGSRAAARFRGALVTAQLALSMALLVSAGLFIKSMVKVSQVDLGLDTESMATFAIAPELSGYSFEESLTFFRRAEEELATIPGVTSVTAGRVPVLGGSQWGNNVSVEGYPTDPDTDTASRFNHIGPGYFRTLGIPLIAGREFTDADAAGAPAVAIVNEAFAEKFNLDARSAVGKRMGIGRTNELDIEIVGVVQNAKYSEVKEVIPPLYFTPYRQDPQLGTVNFYVRSAGDADPVLRAIPETMARLDRDLPVEELKTLAIQVRENVFADRLISRLAATFAILATVLAAVGLYGVLAYSVAQRTREIGLRMALGASAGSVRQMVLRQVGLLLLIGGAIGLAAGLGVGKAAQSLLYEMQASDPLVIGSAVALLVMVATVAAYVPALRASRIDPMRALRYD